jgi:hypothetical protein
VEAIEVLWPRTIEVAVVTPMFRASAIEVSKASVELTARKLLAVELPTTFEVPPMALLPETSKLCPTPKLPPMLSPPAIEALVSTLRVPTSAPPASSCWM